MTDKTKARFVLVPFDQLRVGPEPNYLIKGLLCSTGLVLIYGAPKCGKSFFAFDMFLHVALGWEYRGRRVRQGPIVYFALEGAAGFNARAEAFRARFLPADTDPFPFFLVAARLDLVADHETLIACIRAQLGTDNGCQVKPVAVVIDTLNRSLPGSESHDEDMSAFLRAAGAIEEAFDCLAVVIHHSGTDPRRPRGHSSLTGGADVQIKVERSAAGGATATLEYVKDGPEGEVLAFRIEQVEIGQDSEGDPMTSCVVVPAEAGPRKAPARKLSDKQRIALDALDEALLSAGEPPPPSFDLPNSVRAVPLDRWRQELFARGALSDSDPNPRQDFKRLRDALAARHVIGQRDQLVWKAAP